MKEDIRSRDHPRTVTINRNDVVVLRVRIVNWSATDGEGDNRYS